MHECIWMQICINTNNDNNNNDIIVIIIIGALGTVTKGLVQGLEELEIRGPSKLHYSIIKIGQNTEKSPGDLRRLAVTQTHVRNHRQKSV